MQNIQVLGLREYVVGFFRGEFLGNTEMSIQMLSRFTSDLSRFTFERSVTAAANNREGIAVCSPRVRRVHAPPGNSRQKR